jgi:autotransporter-associated beta strand protein
LLKPTSSADLQPHGWNNPVAALTLNDGTVNAGSSAITVGSLVQNGGTLRYGIAEDTTAPFVVTGNASFTGGVIEITIAGDPVGKTFEVLRYQGTLTGTPVLVFPGVGRTTPSIKLGSGSNDTITVTFPAEAGAVLVWRGNDATNPSRWDLATTANWTNNGVADTFLAGDNPVFNDTAASFAPALQGAIPAGTVTFDHSTNDYTLSGPGSIAAGQFMKRGTGSLTVSSANSFTGPVAVHGGRLRLGNAAALGDSINGAKIVTIHSGGQLDLNAYNNTAPSRSYTLDINGAGPDQTGALVNSGGGISSNAGILHLALSGNATIGGSGRFDIGWVNGIATPGTIAGNGHTLTKTGANQIMLRGDASATPIQIVVAQGILGAENHDAALGGANGRVTVRDGAVLGVWGERVLATPVTLEAGSTLRAMGGGIGNWSGPVVLAGNATVDLSGQAKIISGGISGAGGLTKIGANTLTLSGTNDYWGGTVITQGEVNVTSDTAFGRGSVALQHMDSSTAIIRANFSDVTIANDFVLNTNASIDFRGPINTTDRNTLTTLTGVITIQTNEGNGGHFSSRDGGVLRLSGTLNTTGPIPNLGSGIIEMATTGGNLARLNQGQGTLRLAATNGIQPTVRLDLAVSNSGTLDLNGFNQTLAELHRHTTHAAIVTNSSPTPSVLTIDGAANHEFSGTIENGTGGIHLVKRGSSVFTLSGPFTYGGDTSIEAGTLVLASASLADDSSVHVTAGATLHLPHGASDTVAELWVDGVRRPAGAYDVNNANFITGSGSLVVTSGPVTDPYEDWLADAGLVPGAPGTGPFESADNSGVANLIQFALGGDARDPANNGVKRIFGVADGIAEGQMLLTIAVRKGAVFAGQPAPTATVDGISYSIQGSENLQLWNAPVEAVAPAFDGNGEVSAPPGYELRTFRLTPAPGTGAAGYLRVAVSASG